MEVIMINININHRVYSVDLELNCYADEHARPAISLTGAVGSEFEYEPIARATVNIPEFNQQMRQSGAFCVMDDWKEETWNVLAPSEFTEDTPWTFIKDYSENMGIQQGLIEHNIIEKMHISVRSGFEFVPLVLIKDEELVAQWREQKALVDKKRAMKVYKSILADIKKSYK